MELDSVIYHFASEKITLLLWAQVRPLLGSEAKRTTPLCPGSRLSGARFPLLSALLSAGRGSDRGATVPTLPGPSMPAGWSAPSWPGFYPCCGLLSLGSGNSEPCLWPLPKLPGQVLCCLICCPGPRPHQAKGCPHSTNGRLRQLCQRPLNSWGHQTIVNLFWRLGCIYVCSYYIKYLLLHEAATKRHHSKPILFTVFSNTAFTTNSARFIKIPNKLVISKKKKNNINIMVNFITHS